MHLHPSGILKYTIFLVPEGCICHLQPSDTGQTYQWKQRNIQSCDRHIYVTKKVLTTF